MLMVPMPLNTRVRVKALQMEDEHYTLAAPCIKCRNGYSALFGSNRFRFTCRFILPPNTLTTHSLVQQSEIRLMRFQFAC